MTGTYVGTRKVERAFLITDNNDWQVGSLKKNANY